MLSQAISSFPLGSAKQAVRKLRPSEPRENIFPRSDPAARYSIVMSGLVPAIHSFKPLIQRKTWMTGTGPAMTMRGIGSPP